jgi:hypothetical protein
VFCVPSPPTGDLIPAAPYIPPILGQDAVVVTDLSQRLTFAVPGEPPHQAKQPVVRSPFDIEARMVELLFTVFGALPTFTPENGQDTEIPSVDPEDNTTAVSQDVAVPLVFRSGG